MKKMSTLIYILAISLLLSACLSISLLWQTRSQLWPVVFLIIVGGFILVSLAIGTLILFKPHSGFVIAAVILLIINITITVWIQMAFTRSNIPPYLNTAQTKTFSCPGMKGFTFKYPLQDEYNLQQFEYKNSTLTQTNDSAICLIYLSSGWSTKVPGNLGALMFQVYITAVKQNYSQSNQKQNYALKNGQGIAYGPVTGKIPQQWGMATNEQIEESGYRFELPNFSVSVYLILSPNTTPYPKEIFWKDVISSFKN